MFFFTIIVLKDFEILQTILRDSNFFLRTPGLTCSYGLKMVSDKYSTLTERLV